ncbi:MAG TPA: SDR family oxidoreductase [Polyangiaceae bacterium]|jgi:3-oxoacyl-[acyl-carrier protein] reductase|nr:SDR family oxidoreductase [Polyangiaceae bacterium]
MLQVDLRGKRALITGASGELGRVMATTLARCGADIVVHFHSNSASALLVCQSVEALGRRALAIRADVGSPADIQALAAQIETELGGVEIVVANAVEQIFPWRTVLETPLDSYTSQFNSCVMQNVLLAKAFIPGMQRRGWGRYIGINTECTMQMKVTQSAYVSGKRGMDGLMRVLAREVGPTGITVNQVAPGWTISESQRNNPPDDANYVAEIPLRRRGTDQEIANVVAFLASDLASYVHGAFIPVTGGNVMPTV